MIVEEEKELLFTEEEAGVRDDVIVSQPRVLAQGEVIVCYYHPEREARYTCPKCGQPVCRECFGIRTGEVQCWNCYSSG